MLKKSTNKTLQEIAKILCNDALLPEIRARIIIGAEILSTEKEIEVARLLQCSLIAKHRVSELKCALTNAESEFADNSDKLEDYIERL